jgi:protein-S-isoprenylcysteine O-methyltransferase Ste14
MIHCYFFPPANLMTNTSNRIAALSAFYLEKYVLSFVYLCLSVAEVNKIRGVVSGEIRIETTMFIDTVHHLILLLLCVFASLLLLLGHRPAVPPKRLKFVLIPLVTTFFNVLYFTVPWFPASLQIYLVPQSWEEPLAIAGLTCIAIGPVIALWGLLHLGRSFGIFVSVRKVVLTGPYQWVRHPMYLGWVCVYAGVAMANFSGAYCLLVAIHVSLLLYRAHMEETQLAEHSAEYREYMKRTGFIFPRLRRVQPAGS